MESELNKFKEVLLNNGHFVTKPRKLLFTTLQKQSALTIRELISLLDTQDQATVYRNIKLFEQLGIIKVLWHGWSSKLELSDTFQRHHHHLICFKCGDIKTLEEDVALEKRILAITRQSGFTAADHHLEITGTCSNCS